MCYVLVHVVLNLRSSWKPSFRLTARLNHRSFPALQASLGMSGGAEPFLETLAAAKTPQLNSNK